MHSIFTLILDSIAGVLGGVLLLRFWMQAVRIRPPNSLGQFVFQLTDWLVRPLRKLVPGIGGFDWASLLGAILVAVLSIALDFWLTPVMSVQMILVIGLFRVFQWIVYGLMGMIFIEAVFSWVNPHAPLAPFIQALNAPLLRPLRRIVPLIGNVDLSPLVAIVLLRVALQVASILIAPLV